MKSNIVFIICVFIIVLSPMANSKKINGFDISNLRVEKKALIHGGPQRDGIPAINSPHYVQADKVTFLQAEDKVLGFAFEGKTFAYPRHILNWHEIVNDEVNGKAFVIVYCPLCGSGMAFSSQVNNQKLVFGVSGLLYNSDIVLYDKQTESLWSQLDRLAISGALAGTPLKQLPLYVTSWENWKATHPKTLVLSDQQGFKRNYRHDPYTGYETTDLLFFDVLRDAPSSYHTKEWVLGIEINGVSKAYPYSELQKHNKARFKDEINDKTIEVHWDESSRSAKILNTAGEIMVTTEAFWFAWYNFHPETLIFTSSP